MYIYKKRFNIPPVYCSIFDKTDTAFETNMIYHCKIKKISHEKKRTKPPCDIICITWFG